MERKIIPDIVKRQTISSLKPDNTAFEAATMMATANIGAIVIVDKKDNLSGIVTERDLTRRVVGKGLDPKETKIASIMTKEPDTLAPEDSAGDALELMQSRHYG
ncbi:MAG: CBS domain-containing protein, partial [Proteobacteria bacterium]|nr:CBS domain-containing protein [Pseudomonadota bacterium]